MRSASCLSLLIVLALSSGCAEMRPWKKPAGHATESASQQRAERSWKKESDKELDRQEQERSSHHAANDDENPFTKSRQKNRIKETDRLSELMEGFSDPRTREINRSLGVE